MTYKAGVIQQPLCERELSQVHAEEAFILSKDINTPNPEVYLKLETRSPAWYFLRLSDMKYISAFDLKWTPSEKIYVTIVSIEEVAIRIKLLPK